MVKMLSKDSGYLVQSNVSFYLGGSKDKDEFDNISFDSQFNLRKVDFGIGFLLYGFNIDSLDKKTIMFVKLFLKQDSLVNVSFCFIDKVLICFSLLIFRYLVLYSRLLIVYLVEVCISSFSCSF